MNRQMQDIKHTLEEYERSRDKIAARINEINEDINLCNTSKKDFSVRRLMERRALLYSQKWDLEYAIRELREYLLSVRGEEVALHAG